MRVISSDYTVNVDYSNSIFCIIEDEANSKYYIGIRNNNLTGYLPIATYSTKEDAIDVMKDLIHFGFVHSNSNNYYVLPSEEDIGRVAKH